MCLCVQLSPDGFSAYPGNTNGIIIRLSTYLRTLDETNGLISELIHSAHLPVCALSTQHATDSCCALCVCYRFNRRVHQPEIRRGRWRQQQQGKQGEGGWRCGWRQWQRQQGQRESSVQGANALRMPYAGHRMVPAFQRESWLSKSSLCLWYI